MGFHLQLYCLRGMTWCNSPNLHLYLLFQWYHNYSDWWFHTYMENFNNVYIKVIIAGHHCSKIYSPCKCIFCNVCNINITYETIKKTLLNTWNSDNSTCTKYLIEWLHLTQPQVLHVLHPTLVSHLSRASTASCRLSSDSDSSCTSSSRRRCGSVDTTSCLIQTTWSVSSDPVSTSPASSESSPSALRAAGILLRD